jgi:hypothetical protein
MFPVLEEERKGATAGNHWYCLTMNFQAERFEALDSLRGEGSKDLISHANALISRIKAIWQIHYSSSKVQIQDWELRIVNVPIQETMYNVFLLLSCFSDTSTNYFLSFHTSPVCNPFFLCPLVFFFCSFNCGYHTLYNIEKWDGQNIPHIGKGDVSILRRVLLYRWITADFNKEKENWRSNLFNNAIR